MGHRAVPGWGLGAVAALVLLACSASRATEGAGGLYLLGGQSLDAGLTPAPGWYVTVAALQYDGSVGGAIQGGVKVLELHKRVDSTAVNLLYAPKRRFLGGQLAVSVSAPYAYLRLSGDVNLGTRTVSRAVSGNGFGDMTIGARLGWNLSPSFTHAVALTVWAPTGEYQKGFTPSIGHNRWAGDAIWSFTWAPGGHHTEFSAAIGYGINGPNTVTHYRSGDEAHLELGVGQRLSPHWEVGLAGYVYRQVSADSGSGALLGTLKGRVDGAGPALNYATRLGSHAFIFTARYYKEFDAKRHFQGDLALASATLRF
jgi:hypothetical protein